MFFCYINNIFLGGILMKKENLELDVWWKKAVIYQIYPRSFKDNNNDGIGDINGIISKLDYLNDGTEDSLGIDAIWISPIYKSPMKDFGYDISDYRDIDSIFGNLEDFKLLLQEAHKRNIKIIMDLVINHTSDEHPWFIEAKSNKNSPKRDWYIWHHNNNNKKPNNWVSLFEMKNAWWLDPHTNEYYLGTFTKHQPEVNWYNENLKQEMYNMIRFWFDIGVDGFRMDVVNLYIKDTKLRNNPWKISLLPPDVQNHIYDRNRPETHEICREIRKIAEEYEDRMLIGEIYTSNTDEAAAYHGKENDELHMAFNFNFLFQKWNAKGFYEKIIQWYESLPNGAWPNFTLSNHDQPRHHYRYRDGINSSARAKVAAAMLLTLKGTPFIYYGEEIGMTCEKISKKDLQDPVGIKGWPFIKGRDAERTPMQWNDSDYAGFSKNKPWLPVNSDYKYINVKNQKQDKKSILSFYRSLIWLRKKSKALSTGNIEFITKNPKNILAYKRIYKNDEVIIVLNFSNKNQPFSIYSNNKKNVVLGTDKIKNENLDTNNFILHPYEVLIIS
jgi:alpha-glucosidase